MTTTDDILAALADLAPACRAWVPPPECCCWSGIQQAMETVRKVAGA
jgi:hypothetical protein